MSGDFKTLDGNVSAQNLLQIVRDLLRTECVSTVGVCGLGGTGKSTTSHIVALELSPQVQIFSIDWYLIHPTNERRLLIEEALERGEPVEVAYWENPSAWYDWKEISSAITTLVTCRSLTIENAWNQRTGLKDLDVEVTLPEEGSVVILVDGIYLLHPEIASQLDTVVLLEGSPEQSFAQSISRDSHRSPAEYLSFKERLLEEFDIPYFEKYRASADYIITLED
jgi:uridine kinase